MRLLQKISVALYVSYYILKHTKSFENIISFDIEYTFKPSFNFIVTSSNAVIFFAKFLVNTTDFDFCTFHFNGCPNVEDHLGSKKASFALITVLQF